MKSSFCYFLSTIFLSFFPPQYGPAQGPHWKFFPVRSAACVHLLFRYNHRQYQDGFFFFSSNNVISILSLSELVKLECAEGWKTNVLPFSLTWALLYFLVLSLCFLLWQCFHRNSKFTDMLKAAIMDRTTTLANAFL